MSNGQRRAEGEKGPYLHSFSFVQLYPIFFFFLVCPPSYPSPFFRGETGARGRGKKTTHPPPWADKAARPNPDDTPRDNLRSA